jgi:hypothetical protein
MVVDMSLAEMLLFEILMRGVRVPERRMIVLVLMRRTQVLEGTGLMASVVGHVEVLMCVHQLLVVVLLRLAHVQSPVCSAAPNFDACSSPCARGEQLLNSLVTPP